MSLLRVLTPDSAVTFPWREQARHFGPLEAKLGRPFRREALWGEILGRMGDVDSVTGMRYFLYRDLQMPNPGARKGRHLQQCLVLSLLVFAGCTRWRAGHVSPATLLTPEPPTRIRITRVDKSRIELHHPRLVGDTITDGRTQHGTSTKVPLNDVAQVAIRKWDPFGTAGLALGAVALGTVVTIDARAD